jgi:hypothetical protein
MRAAATVLGAAVLAACLAACGNDGRSSQRSPTSQWTANALGVIDQLRADAVGASDGDSVASARAALHDESRLYGLLVVYSDFGGCRHMASALGAAPAGFDATVASLARACTDLQRAAVLFTRAAASSDPPSLVAATRVVRSAEPLLERAELELRAASRGHP